MQGRKEGMDPPRYCMRIQLHIFSYYKHASCLDGNSSVVGMASAAHVPQCGADSEYIQGFRAGERLCSTYRRSSVYLPCMLVAVSEVREMRDVREMREMREMSEVRGMRGMRGMREMRVMRGMRGMKLVGVLPTGPHRMPSAEDLAQMKYLNAVVKEILRMWVIEAHYNPAGSQQASVVIPETSLALGPGWY